ncbi:RmlC-like cupins superfamily protein [Arabidopsis thaliana]|uniref:RmlC-like cupins superfamily protein n=1 Tax=Arabidopsis thaliana TaxID=3702 RepID=A0A1P8BH00_ARATH|nr:RmlC-like cupins superfamily protein [Arabidopsis thaliana]ANM70878.1 RmlC-like cupins superfamily protein [Arabidopsis thaliana]|eukprot:NP_001332456.1 RmlC-like cupins superfamily protein [Arabidopsis thaliana]
MKSFSFLAVLSILAITLSLSKASDPSSLQDFCVGVNTPADGVFVNGKFCKDPKLVTVEDFFFTGLHEARPPNPKTGSNVTAVNVNNLPGLNTLGISLVRIDYGVYGQNPPHTHPRASEGLIHFQVNVGKYPAVAFAGLSSQNPGVITIADTVFGSNPQIDPSFLASAFQVDPKIVMDLQTKFIKP